MAKVKYYAVRSGRKTGIFTSWEECKKQVMGYSSAVYKSFTDREEAERFMAAAAPKSDKSIDERVKIYVDGSFDVGTGRFSYGMAVLDGDMEITDNKAFVDPELAAMRNVAGEIKGSMAAMQYCLDKGIDDVVIYYDYEGIAKWCTGEWKTNKEGTKAYAAFYNSIKDRLNVEFRHVKGHSGDKYNDLVDHLAKQALGLA